jgi:hypothetical protein
MVKSRFFYDRVDLRESQHYILSESTESTLGIILGLAAFPFLGIGCLWIGFCLVNCCKVGYYLFWNEFC